MSFSYEHPVLTKEDLLKEKKPAFQTQRTNLTHKATNPEYKYIERDAVSYSVADRIEDNDELRLVLFGTKQSEVLLEHVEKVHVAEKSVCFHGEAADWVKHRVVDTRRSSKQKPAFTAYISPDTSYEAGQIYKFTKVKLNVRRMYNPKDGKATIPSDGNYAVTWHILTDGGNAVYPWLKVNNSYEGIAACDARGSKGIRMACGNLVVLPLKKGDKIWIEEWTSNTRTRKNVQSGYSSFSAWKI
ncbi:unnamed protein product [Mytilus edulis]|uniref:C1q domain-containing protein n=1 Tax=Mytilus edulis TaxID=6550 RepID=A0A8S3SDU2_MYTED|nr:unnamed protein product [Mytilus edulis]